MNLVDRDKLKRKLETAAPNFDVATVWPGLAVAIALLDAMPVMSCETCKDSSQTEHGDFCCEIGLEMVDYEPFPDGFSCSEWETRP